MPRVLSAPSTVQLTFARVGLRDHSGAPWQIVVEVLALLAVEAHGVVGTLAAPVYHVRAVKHAGQGQAARGVPVARTRPSHHHVVDAVVVFLLQEQVPC